jgi:dienelactone hydrolase
LGSYRRKMRAFLSSMVILAVASADAADLVYSVDGMERVTVRSNVPFKSVEGSDLKADFYLPLGQSNSTVPAVIFVLGDASPEQLRNAKDWTFFQSYGRLAAASGFAGVTFNHRSSENLRKLADVQSDIRDAVSFVRGEGKKFGIDPKRLCLWYFSGAGPHLGIGMGTNASFARCIVAYYPILAPTPGHANFEEFSALAQMRRHAPNVPPLLLVKAGRDAPGLNRLIDEFRTEAERLGLPLEYLEHPTGPHAFDIRDDSEVSRGIIRKTMMFIQRHCAEAGSQAPSKREDAK